LRNYYLCTTESWLKTKKGKEDGTPNKIQKHTCQCPKHTLKCLIPGHGNDPNPKTLDLLLKQKKEEIKNKYAEILEFDWIKILVRANLFPILIGKKILVRNVTTDQPGNHYKK